MTITIHSSRRPFGARLNSGIDLANATLPLRVHVPSAPPPAAPTRPLDTDVTCLPGPSAPQAACHGSTPHYPKK